jgi:ParB-like chromosome segregation protein Spo0J
MKKERKDISIAQLKTPDKNTRIHPEKQVKEIRRSVRQFGQYKNIVVDENYFILAGNGLVEALRAEGYKKVTAMILYGLTDNQKKKLMMADNKTAGLGIDNLNNIEAIIKELDGDFDIPGFDDEVLASISAASEEISEALEDYGKATAENLEQIEAHANANEFSDDDGSGEPGGGAGVSMAAEQEQENVTCPECGAVVWL